MNFPWQHKEAKRKAVHVIGGLLIVGWYLSVSELLNARAALMGLVLALVLLFGVEYLRLELRMMPFLKQVLRPEEERRPSSAVPMVAGSVIAFAAFDASIAVAAVLMATIGDATAHWVRKRLNGSPEKRPTQLTQADLVIFFINLFVAFIVLQDWNIALPMALAATAVEAMSFSLDDNLTMPVASGFVGQLVAWVIF